MITGVATPLSSVARIPTAIVAASVTIGPIDGCSPRRQRICVICGHLRHLRPPICVICGQFHLRPTQSASSAAICVICVNLRHLRPTQSASSAANPICVICAARHWRYTLVTQEDLHGCSRPNRLGVPTRLRPAVCCRRLRRTVRPSVVGAITCVACRGAAARHRHR